MMNWVFVATLLCGVTTFLTGCKEAKTQENNTAQTVKSEELIRTSSPLVRN